MTHIMADLETLSTSFNATILAIGAVKFDSKKKVYDRFYQVVETPCEVEGFHICSNTLSWWGLQSEEARAVFTDTSAVDISTALTRFTAWALDGEDKKDIRLWGNGASFDNVILSTAYTLCDLPPPWMYYNDRCYRTIKNLHPTTTVVRIGTHHDAMDDAETQAVHLLAMEIPLA
jgi:exodeoxyribonuclease VIII